MKEKGLVKCMKLTFIGADHEVTGSCHLLQANGKNILIDYGMEQGRNLFENQPIPVPENEIDYVLLTHAHIDHSGMLPLLCRNGFKGQVVATIATIGHWEIAGVISPNPLPTFPNGFPKKMLEEFGRRTGRGILCNQPYSGTEVIKAYGDEHVRSGSLIVYTSADSVFQIAAHEDVVPVEELYHCCEIARELLTGELGVGRVIARPFIGANGNYTRTSNRHDFSSCRQKIQCWICWLMPVMIRMELVRFMISLQEKEFSTRSVLSVMRTEWIRQSPHFRRK